MVESLDDVVVMRCPNNVTHRVERKKILTPQMMVDNAGTRGRQKCEDASAPPVWKGPGGVGRMPIEEVGYGRPFRWEMARMVAGEEFFMDYSEQC